MAVLFFNVSSPVTLYSTYIYKGTDFLDLFFLSGFPGRRVCGM
jgi:hypothetical protein